MNDLTVDPEFAGLCPALTIEERSLLEASINQDGCRDPIIVWANHDDVIVDGHNRYEICRSLGVKFTIKALVFEDRHAVRNWIIANQLGRRNASDEQKSYLRGQRYLGEKKESHRPKGGNACHLSEKTAERIATETGVSEKTIRNDASFAAGVDAAEEACGKPVKDAILAGTIKASRTQVASLAKMPKPERKAAVKSLQEAKAPAKKQKRHRQPLNIALMNAIHKVLIDWPNQHGAAAERLRTFADQLDKRPQEWDEVACVNNLRETVDKWMSCRGASAELVGEILTQISVELIRQKFGDLEPDVNTADKLRAETRGDEDDLAAVDAELSGDVSSDEAGLGDEDLFIAFDDDLLDAPKRPVGRRS